MHSSIVESVKWQSVGWSSWLPLCEGNVLKWNWDKPRDSGRSSPFVLRGNSSFSRDLFGKSSGQPLGFPSRSITPKTIIILFTDGGSESVISSGKSGFCLILVQSYRVRSPWINKDCCDSRYSIYLWIQDASQPSAKYEIPYSEVSPNRYSLPKDLSLLKIAFVLSTSTLIARMKPVALPQ